MNDAARALLATWRARVSLALALPLGLALWSNSLSDHLGYASALIAALFASVAGALGGAALAASLRRRALTVDGPTAVTIAALYPLALVALVGLTVLAHALFAPACAPKDGALWWLLVPAPGAVLAGLAGLALGRTFTRRGLATTLAALLVPASIAWSLARFYTTPTIFAYDPFYGFFPGAIYDESIPLGLPLVTYRLGTLGAITALAAALVATWNGHASLRSRAPSWAVAALGLAVAAGVWLAGPALGHRHTARDIAERLEGEAWSRRCVVAYDRSIDARQARLTARDCDVRIAQLEAFYGVRVRRRVTVFLFASAEQKQSLMGAADTYIAKPWRYEVYLQYAPFPHPVLKHELAHVVAAEMAPGPLHVTTQGSLLPVPGIIEGAAVAAAWEGESEATPHQWSRAMLEAGMAPRMRALASLSFFTSASVTAYTAAGSFCRWLHDSFGAERFRRLYATGDFAAAYGRPLAALERDWHTFLRAVPVSDRTLARARTRFRRASIFGRHCPHTLEALSEEAARHLAAGDLTRAGAEYATLAERDPTDLRTRVQLAVVRVRRGELAAAEAVAREATRDLGEAAGNRVQTSIADAVWRWRGPAEAVARYQRLDASLLEEDEARTLSLKRAMLESGGEREAAFRDLLIGRESREPSAVVATARAAALLAVEHDPLAAYLVGRQYFLHERFEEALATLDELEVARAGDPRVLAETRRMRAVANWRLGRYDDARRGFEALADDATRPLGLRDAAADWVDRITREGR